MLVKGKDVRGLPQELERHVGQGNLSMRRKSLTSAWRRSMSSRKPPEHSPCDLPAAVKTGRPDYSTGKHRAGEG